MVCGRLGFCTAWAVDPYGGPKEWVEVVELDLHIKKLPDAFVDKRIIHISDLHCSRTVSSRYLGHCIKRINQLNADIVVLTGDYITYDIRGNFSEKVISLISRISSSHGIYACMGNHDYGVDGFFGPLLRHQRFHNLINGMQQHGIKVLRNESAVLEIDGKALWFVGLGDLWADDFEPEKAFDRVRTTDGAVITLAHNPESLLHMDGFGYDAVLSGHTHGTTFQFSKWFGGPVMKRHRYRAGLYSLGGRKLYVNRGLGRHGRVLFNARPEITVYSLRPQ